MGFDTVIWHVYQLSFTLTGEFMKTDEGNQQYIHNVTQLLQISIYTYIPVKLVPLYPSQSKSVIIIIQLSNIQH